MFGELLSLRTSLKISRSSHPERVGEQDGNAEQPHPEHPHQDAGEAHRRRTRSAPPTPPAHRPRPAARPPRRRTRFVKVAETAVDVPVGVALNASDRVQELVEPWTDRATAERQLQVLPDPADPDPEARRASWRHRPPQGHDQATRTRTRLEREVRRVEREARQRQRKAETTVRQNRRRAETTLRRNRRQAETAAPQGHPARREGPVRRRQGRRRAVVARPGARRSGQRPDHGAALTA